MFKLFVNAWKLKEVRKKLLYVLLIVFIYRIGAAIPLPGVSITAWEYMRTNGTNKSLFATVVGGGFGTVFAMGIGPYITSSIIMQLLTVAIPSLEQLKKEGDVGRKKINQITRVVAVFLSIFQAIGMVFIYSNEGLFRNLTLLTHITAIVSLVTGTIFIMWLGELLTERGIGNGSSFIIFSNIISGSPAGIAHLYQISVEGGTAGVLKSIFLIILFLILIVFAILIQDGERRIQVQNSKKMSGSTFVGGQSSYIPLKVNIAGVMSIIFALSLLQLPATIHGFTNSQVLQKIANYLNITSPIGAVIYIIFIILFTFFYTSFAINPIEMAENMKKSGGFIPGIRPGKPTSEFIETTVNRLACIGACFYVILAMIPVVLQWVLRIKVGFGGTTLLIVTGVALEIVKQLQSQMLMRHYKGFLS